MSTSQEDKADRVINALKDQPVLLALVAIRIREFAGTAEGRMLTGPWTRVDRKAHWTLVRRNLLDQTVAKITPF